MNGEDIKSLINATVPKMPDAEPDRRELLKSQAQQLLRSAAERGAVYAENAKRCPLPLIDREAEKRYLDAQVLLYELRKRKRDERF